MSEAQRITVIGASNIDLIGFSKEKLIFKDSNVGTIETILGGVGRNIAESLARLDIGVDFLTVLADDEFSQRIIKSCESLGISIENSLTIPDSVTSIYLAILNRRNDLALGLAAMDIYDELPDSFILDNLEVIGRNKYCLLESNMPVRTLELVTESLPEVRFAMETVSAKKALKARTILDRLYILKCNLLEAELLSEMKVNLESDVERIVEHFLNMGIQKVFITMGKDGVAYGDSNGIWISQVKIISAQNTNGAGDAFMAGILYGECQGFDNYKMVQFGSACSRMTIQHKLAVHPDMSVSTILKEMS